MFGRVNLLDFFRKLSRSGPALAGMPFFKTRVGWVRENHPSLWDEKLGCQWEAGMPCRCNGGEEPDLSAVLIEENTELLTKR
jgi:hypothetical protein